MDHALNIWIFVAFFVEAEYFAYKILFLTHLDKSEMVRKIGYECLLD